MKLIIAGGRTISLTVKQIEEFRIDCNIPINDIEEIVSGGCRGVDQIGERYAEIMCIPVTQFLADWKKFGRSAGPKRNEQMAIYADALMLFWNGSSRGSFDMKQRAIKRKLLIYEKII